MDLSDDQTAVLEQFRPRSRGPAAGIRLWHILTRVHDQTRAKELVALGLLAQRRQRKGFPSLYLITDTGMAALPAEAPEQAEPSRAVLMGHTSPPRGC